MQEFASEDFGVKKEIARESLADLDQEFDFGIEEQDEENWVEKLTYVKGELANTIANAQIILTHDPRVKGKFATNLFTQRAMVMEILPWSNDTNRDWNDTDDSGIRDFMEKYWKFTSPGKLLDAMNLVFIQNSFHPIRDYLNSLTWDGVKRLEDLIIDYLGAEDSPYTKAVCKLHLVAAVARVFRPGCKYDYMLTLTGKQGLGKSTFIRYLASDTYFNDSISELRGKDTMEALQGSWLIELGEMSATKKADVEVVKQFIAKTSDRYRPPYGRRTVDFPRQSIFWGTTNDEEFLRDKTGNRRFFPVDVGVHPCLKDVFTDLKEERDQIWAEAVSAYKAGFRLYLDKDLAEEAIRQQEAHAEESSKFGMAEEYLKRRLPMDWYSKTLVERRAYINKELDTDFDEPFEDTIPREKVCVMEIWCELLNGDPKALTPINAREINDIMRVMPGWEKAKSGLRFGDVYGQQRAYIKSENAF
jgi:predicted P-loop ATPase